MKKRHLLLILCVFTLLLASIPGALCYPPAGSDYLPNTEATVELKIETEIVSMNLVGSTTVKRSGPYDPGDGRLRIDTEIVSMNLVGNSSHMEPVRIIESPSKKSNGTVRQLSPGQDFPADSFFDVFVEIQTTLPSPLSTLHNDDPVFMYATIYSIPPWETVYNSTHVSVPLKNELDEIIGYIIHVFHEIGYPLVGGMWVPVDKFSLLAPYVGLISTLIAATVATAIYATRVKGRKDKR